MLIVIEGCVGVGKTTVAQGLARHRGSPCLLEDFEKNPFLTAFYADPSEHAIEAEFSFLLLHFNQLKKAESSSEIVSDFHLWKDLLYASLNLQDLRSLQAFGHLYDLLRERVPAPSLMVFLSGSSDLILERIARRQREAEVRASSEYFLRLNQAYEQAIQDYRAPKLVLPMDQWDFVARPGLFAELSRLINDELTR